MGNMSKRMTGITMTRKQIDTKNYRYSRKLQARAALKIMKF